MHGDDPPRGARQPTPNATTPLIVAVTRSVSSVTLSGRIPRSMSVRPETPTNSASVVALLS